jgi:hypothetical protein
MSGISIREVYLDLMGEEVRWDKGGIEPANDYTFFYEKGMLIIT